MVYLSNYSEADSSSYSEILTSESKAPETKLTSSNFDKNTIIENSDSF